MWVRSPFPSTRNCTRYGRSNTGSWTPSHAELPSTERWPKSHSFDRDSTLIYMDFHDILMDFKRILTETRPDLDRFSMSQFAKLNCPPLLRGQRLCRWLSAP